MALERLRRAEGVLQGGAEPARRLERRGRPVVGLAEEPRRVDFPEAGPQRVEAGHGGGGATALDLERGDEALRPPRALDQPQAR